MSDEQAMSLEVALDFADNPRPYHTLQAPADTNGELYEALKVIAAAYRAARSVPEAGKAVDAEMTDRRAALLDSQYRAGAKAGWNAQFADDPDAAIAAITKYEPGALASVPTPSGAEPAEERGAKTEAVLRRDGYFLTLNWWRHGKQFSARVYEPQGLLLSPALADVLVLALEEPRAPQAVPAEDIAK